MNKSMLCYRNKSVFANVLRFKFASKQLCFLSSNINDKEYHVTQKGVEFSSKNKNKSNQLVWKSTSSHKTTIDKAKNWRNEVIDAFLPKGYPHSVKPQYLRYSILNGIGMAASTGTGVLSTQSLLLAVGLSASTAIPISGGLNWVLKDGLGQLGGIIFASLVNTHLDEDPKHWRFVTALLLEISTFLEVLSPFFPGYFLLVASLANVGKNVAWLLGGGSRAGIHKSLCKKENLGDITAKCGSQVTFCTLFGTAAGIAVSPFIGGSPLGLFISYAIFASIHLSCIFFAVTDVELNTLNWQRSYFLTTKYINDGVIDIPKVIAHTEHTFFPGITFRPKIPLTLGYLLNKAFPNPDLFIRRMNLINNNKEYVISLIRKKKWYDSNIPSICILYNNDKTNNKVLLKSYLHGHYIRKLLLKEDGDIDMDKFEKWYSNPVDFDEVIKETYEQTCKKFDLYYDELVNKGWNTESLFFDNEKYRFTQKS